MREEGLTTTTADEGPEAGGQGARTACLFRILDCERPLERSARYALDQLDAVFIGRGAAEARRETAEGQRRLELKLADRWVSTQHARLRRLLGRWVIEDGGSRNGTLINGLRVSSAVLGEGDLLECGHTFFLFSHAAAGDEAPFAPEGAPEVATLCAELERDLRALAQVAPSSVPVLIHGESGVGKEVVARALHTLSGRRGALVAVNCGALPQTLVESELFGYRKGAFSEAREDRLGLIRSADGGTLFLDEIGDLSAASQAALLRVLQEREVLPLGATRPVPVDFRLCAATHRSLPAMVEEGTFRGDLHSRLTGLQVRVPPLRERRQDLGLLMSALIQRTVARPESARLRPEAARALLQCDWPYNVRELATALSVGFALAPNGLLEVAHLPESVREAPARRNEPEAEEEAAESAPEDEADTIRRQELARLMAEHQGNISAVARAMGKDRVQIRRWLKRYRLDQSRLRSS